MKVYALEYTDCIYEGAPGTISLHKTKKGAYIAMLESKRYSYNKWFEDRQRWGKGEIHFSVSRDYKFAHEFERYFVREIEILD